MRMSERGTLIVYSGPSGVGKGTLLQPYLAAHPQARLSVSVTTRDPRPGEVDGIHYWFITQERFDRLVAEGDWISVRGLGKAQLTQVTGATKKGRTGVILSRCI